MKMDIRQEIEPIDVLGRLEPVELTSNKLQVYLDDKRVPPTLEKIILTGLHVLMHDYLDDVEAEMKRLGWRRS